MVSARGSAGSKMPESFVSSSVAELWSWGPCGDHGEPLPGQALEPQVAVGCRQVPTFRGATPVLGRGFG